MPSPFSFRSIPNSILDSIKNHTIINLYSKFSFFYISIKSYNEEERENNQESIINLLFCSLKDFKFVTIYLNDNNNQNIQNPNNNNNTELEERSVPTDIDAFFCTEEKLIIIQQINLSTIKSLISRLQEKKVVILNTGLEFDIFKDSQNEQNLREEINSFRLKFKSEIKQNDFVKATISPIAGYVIRRFFYPSHYFKDSSFFNFFDEYKMKEENMKTKLYKLIFQCSDIDQFAYQFNQIIQEMKSEIIDDEKVNNTTEFKSEDFIQLRLISFNSVGNYYLVIHLKSFHIFMMKKLKKTNEPKREIYFCEKFSHRCFTRFYGFIKEGESIKAIIYEYMCNGTLNEYINKADPIFSLIAMVRLFESIEYLYSKSLIHRDLKPSNILLDHNFLPYISDFETIRDPGTDEPMTNDLGSILYSSPEQDEGGYISFPTDIYSFGLIIFFLYEKKNFYTNNSYDKTSNHTNIFFLPKSKTSENIQNLIIKCTEFSQEKRFSHSEIKSSIIEEINTFDLINFSEENETKKKIEIIELVYENSLFQYERKDDFLKWFFDIMKYCFNPFKVNEQFSQDNSKKFFYIGYLYFLGKGVEPNFNKAKEYFELSAKQNNSSALFYLGNLYYEGLGVGRNYNKAKEYFELSAKQNNSDALFYLGHLYYEGLGVGRNYNKAKEFFELSAKQNNSDALLNLGKFYVEGLGVERNYNKAIEYFELSAKQNNSDALFNLGVIYAKGHGVKQNYYKAIEYFELSATQNNPYALLHLGFLYAKGLIVEQNYLIAKEYYELSAKQNNPSALFNLGVFYTEGLGVEQNYLIAKEYFELSAKQNNSYAFLCLGIFYVEGRGVEQNYYKAKVNFELSAIQNNAEALLHLGILYSKGLGVDQNYKKAKVYFELSAIQNNSYALLHLGFLYSKGLGVDQNFNKAKEYFELSAIQNNSDALYNLGIFYREGIIVEQNYNKAKEYFELSAKQNNSNALYNLGNLYYEGQGVEQNYNKAKEYFELSAKQNNSYALFLLGIIHENGLGVPKDLYKTKYYYELSAKHNNPYANLRLARIYLNENLTSKNLTKYKEKLEKAAQFRVQEAFLELGNMHYYGIGTIKNFKEAAKNYQKAANLNNSDAYLKLGEMYLLGRGVEKDLIKGRKYLEYSTQLNNSVALYILGNLYSTGDIFDADISKSIQYLNKCKEKRFVKNKSQTSGFEIYTISNRYNIFYYRSMNDLGLIYLTVFDDIEKAIDNIKESAFGEYPFGQNNYGLLYQFYLNNLENAEYFYKRSSEHQFALAEYNLGYLKEQESKTEEAIEYYIRASEHEDVPLEFQKLTHIDIRLVISKIFIIFYTNIKLTVYYFIESKLEECKKYFIKAFSKFINKNDIFAPKQIQHIIETKGNLFSFLKYIIFFDPAFHFINQPNLISKRELNEIKHKASLILMTYKKQKVNGLCNEYMNRDKKQETKKHSKDDNQQKENESKKEVNCDEDFNEFEYKKYFTPKQIQRNNEYKKNVEEIPKYKNFEYNIKEQVSSENNKTEYNDNKNEIENNDSKIIIQYLSALFEIIIKESNFLNEMNGIIEIINKILYKPPYDILFGRISIAKPISKGPNPPKNINKTFYEGFDIK